MEASAVLGLLDLMGAAGIRAWVAGGWAVDAVVGRQTRPHGDLDLAVDAAQLDAVFPLLAEQGLAVTVDWLPSRVELTSADGRLLDLHPVTLRPDGSGIQSGLDGAPGFEYPGRLRYGDDRRSPGPVSVRRAAAAIPGGLPAARRRRARHCLASSGGH